MKKLLFIMAMMLPLFTFVGCSDDNEDVIEQKEFTFIYSFDNSDNINTKVTLFEYNDLDEKIGTNDIDNPEKDKKYTFTANKRSEKIKVYMTLSSSLSASSTKKVWVQQVYYLEEGKNIDIKITGKTITGSFEP